MVDDYDFHDARPARQDATKKMPDIQVFGREDSSATRAALRFFRERRIVVHYVDLRKRPIAPGELRRFTERLGARALLDDGSKAYQDAGLGYLSLTTMASPSGCRPTRACCGCPSSATATRSRPGRPRRSGRAGSDLPAAVEGCPRRDRTKGDATAPAIAQRMSPIMTLAPG